MGLFTPSWCLGVSTCCFLQTRGSLALASFPSTLSVPPDRQQCPFLVGFPVVPETLGTWKEGAREDRSHLSCRPTRLRLIPIYTRVCLLPIDHWELVPLPRGIRIPSINFLSPSLCHIRDGFIPGPASHCRILEGQNLSFVPHALVCWGLANGIGLLGSQKRGHVNSSDGWCLTQTVQVWKEFPVPISWCSGALVFAALSRTLCLADSTSALTSSTDSLCFCCLQPRTLS